MRFLMDSKNFPNRQRSYNRAYAYGEYMQHNGYEGASFGIVELTACHVVEFWQNGKLIATESIPADFNEPGTLG